MQSTLAVILALAASVSATTVYQTSTIVVTACPTSVQSCPASTVTTSFPVSYLSTSTLYSTSTIYACPSSVQSCPASMASTTTVVVPVSTTVCPLALTQTSSGSSTYYATVAPTTPAVPVSTSSVTSTSTVLPVSTSSLAPISVCPTTCPAPSTVYVTVTAGPATTPATVAPISAGPSPTKNGTAIVSPTVSQIAKYTGNSASSNMVSAGGMGLVGLVAFLLA